MRVTICKDDGEVVAVHNLGPGSLRALRVDLRVDREWPGMYTEGERKAADGFLDDLCIAANNEINEAKVNEG